ncbi:thioredoxin family protein [Flavobacteriaceae bacterium KMM 6898]|nr:thioredoxin family protein [Flavobacteriaceae bacterium KMM 6898]
MEYKIKGKASKELIIKGVSQALSYNEYGLLMDKLVLDSGTTGLEQSQMHIDYTKLNQKRMRRLDKTIKLDEEIRIKLAEISVNMTWLVLNESWCGDAAQILPVINKIASLNPYITLKIILRDENLELMECFLTKGSRSIPKLLAIDPISNDIRWTWGPRPSKAERMAYDYKKEHGELTPQFKEELQVWYNRDKGKNTVANLMGLLFLE